MSSETPTRFALQMPSEQRLVRHSVSRGQAAQPCALWRCVRSIATADDCLRRNASASPATPPRMVPHPHRPALAHRSHVRRNNQTADNRVRELHDTGGARNAACGCRPNPAHAGWSPPRGAASSLNVHAETKKGRRFKIRYSTTAAIRRNPGWRELARRQNSLADLLCLPLFAQTHLLSCSKDTVLRLPFELWPLTKIS